MGTHIKPITFLWYYMSKTSLIFLRFLLKSDLPYQDLPFLSSPSWSVQLRNQWLSFYHCDSLLQIVDLPLRSSNRTTQCTLIIDCFQSMFFYIFFRINIFLKYMFKYFFCNGTINGFCICKCY